jgi:hypothetical protein
MRAECHHTEAAALSAWMSRGAVTRGRGIVAPLPREGRRERTCRRPSKQRRSLHHHREDAEIGGVKRIRLSGGIEERERERERERAAFVCREPPPPPGCCGAGARLGAAARARAGGRDSRGRERVVDRDGRGFGIRWAPQGRGCVVEVGGGGLVGLAAVICSSGTDSYYVVITYLYSYLLKMLGVFGRAAASPNQLWSSSSTNLQLHCGAGLSLWS